MSKLSKAPLVEVIFELRWKVTKQSDLARCQYLHGDLFSLLKDDYPEREPLTSPEIPLDFLVNSPVHRFRKSKEGYPLFQVGPGLLSLNTTDESYFWDEYFNWVKVLLKAFFQTYQFESNEKFQTSLTYIDFFELDFSNSNVLDFANKFLGLKIEQNFHEATEPPSNFKFNISYPTSFGQLSISIETGHAGKFDKKKGLVLQTKIIGDENQFDLHKIYSWMNESHDLCSSLFKEMTKGDLYNSFN